MIGGRDTDVIQRWLLDADQYKAELRDVARMIQQQQRHERDLSVVREELAKQSARLSTATVALGSAIGGALTAAVGKAIDAMKGAAAATEKWLRASPEQIESLRSLSNAVSGVVDPMTLLRARMIAMNADAPLTQRQLENIAKAGVELGRRLGIGATEGVEKLTQSVIGGRGLERNLRLLGSSIDLTGSDSQKLVAALDELERKFGGMDIHAKNSAERMQALRSEVSLLWAEMIKAVQSTEIWKRAMTNLSTAAAQTRETLSERGLAGTIRTVFDWAVLPRDVAEVFERRRRADDRLRRSLETAPINVYTEEGALKFSEDEGITVGLGPRPRSGRRRTEKGPYDPYRSVAGLEAVEREAAAWREAERLAERTMVERERERLREQADEEREQMQRRQREEEEQLRRKIAAWDREADAIKRNIALHQQLNKELRNVAVGGLASFVSGLWQAADAAVAGEASIGAAIAATLKAVMQSLAIESTAKAIFNLAEAAANWINPYAVEEHLRAAALYSTVAVIAGAASLGMTAAGVGRSSAASGAHGAPGTATSSDGAYYSGARDRTRERDERPIILELHIDSLGSDSAAAIQVRRQIKQMMAS